MLDAAVDGTFKASTSRARTSPSRTRTPASVTAGCEAMECVVVQDLFLNETASFAHVFLPGSSFLEKDGTFTNAERRISRVRKVMPPRAGHADWEITQMLSNALGYRWLRPSVRDHGRDRRLTPTFAGVTATRSSTASGSIQWPCNESHPEGTAVMHAETGSSVARAVHDHGICRHRWSAQPPLPADPHDRPHPERSTTSAPRPAAPPTCDLA
jgi:formate dehydrogenase major subunit